MLQKPSPKSKAKKNAEYLSKRLHLWKEGNLNSIMSEVKEIQSRLKASHKIKEESKSKGFCRLMFQGKVRQAMKLINNNDDVKGVHKLTRKIKGVLEDKHPPAKKAPKNVMLEITTPPPEPVIFEAITAESVYHAAKNIHGSGGPTLIDADGWRQILCSKSYGNTSNQLCEAIAELAKTMSTEEVDPTLLSEYLSCRLIPLDKGADEIGGIGVRPIGVGEVIRRIIGKVIVDTVKQDIQDAVGPLQTCAGLKSGIEASIHATKDCWEDPDTEAVLLVDADNAFNRINRDLAVHNIRSIVGFLQKNRGDRQYREL